MADTADIELPPEVQDALGAHDERRPDVLAALATKIIERRTEAVAHRKSSGIEQVWQKAEEAYLGIDDANRGQYMAARWIKPTTMTGPVTTASTGGKREPNRQSTAFVRLTSRYVDAGAAKVSEILLPIGEKAFKLKPTPMPEIVSALNDATQVTEDLKDGRGPQPLYRDLQPYEKSPPGAAPSSPGGAPAAPNAGTPPAAPAPTQQVPLTLGDLAKEQLEKLTERAKRAEQRIYDWMVESRFPAEMRKVIFDMARLGTGILKGPFPDPRTNRSAQKVAGGVKVTIAPTLKPTYRWVPVWNMYPDPACGEHIGDGDYLFEYDQYSKRQLRKYKNDPTYIGSAIDKLIDKGPKGNADEGAPKPDRTLDRHRYNVWHFYGTVTREEMLAAGAIKEGEDKDKAEFYAIITMVDDTIVKAAINPLDSGEFPYHNVPWQRRADFWAGVGVAEQLEMPQAAINAATRAMFNNAGKAAGSIVVANRSAVEPADGNWVLTPDKFFYLKDENGTDDVHKAFAFFQVPNTTNQLMAIVEYCLRMAEESTNIPLVTQGQSGSTTPETYGATQLQNNNANQLLRSIGYAFDDYITEPVVIQSYEMLLLDPDVPEDEKGDWAIEAHGSVSLVERAIEDQTVSQMGQFALQPAFGVDPKRWFAQFAKTKHLNPADFQYTAAEQAEIDARGVPPAPAVQVAQIRSADIQRQIAAAQTLEQLKGAMAKALAEMGEQTKLSIAGMRRDTDMYRVKVDTDRDTAYVESQRARDEANANARMEELKLKRDLALLDYQSKHQLSTDQLKARLADTEMRLQVERELTEMEHGVDLHKHHNPVAQPAAEPPGKAKPGEAFTG